MVSLHPLHHHIYTRVLQGIHGRRGVQPARRRRCLAVLGAQRTGQPWRHCYSDQKLPLLVKPRQTYKQKLLEPDPALASVLATQSARASGAAATTDRMVSQAKWFVQIKTKSLSNCGTVRSGIVAGREAHIPTPAQGDLVGEVPNFWHHACPLMDSSSMNNF